MEGGEGMTSPATHPTWMDFLEASFGDAVSHARRVAVVGLPGPRTRLCGSLDEARSAIASLSHAHDVFTGVGLVDCGDDRTPKGRGTASDVCAIGCLWADIDLGGGVHANERLPRNEDDVRRILERVWATPTAIVRSGHAWPSRNRRHRRCGPTCTAPSRLRRSRTHASMRDPARTAMRHDRRDATRSLTTAIAPPATRPVSAAWCDLPA
jgi:hypothetical protein